MRRIYLRDLMEHDELWDDCVVRSLEMTVDHLIAEQGYIIQFWRDVCLYGVDEAILYVENGCYGDAAVIRLEWNKIKARIAKAAKNQPKRDSLHPNGY